MLQWSNLQDGDNFIDIQLTSFVRANAFKVWNNTCNIESNTYVLVLATYYIMVSDTIFWALTIKLCVKNVYILLKSFTTLLWSKFLKKMLGSHIQ